VPPAPRAPEVISRNDAGDATVRAVRLDGPLDIDGELNEPVYGQVPALSDFIQSLPDEGVPATELTEAWILYDDENVYVSARVHEEVPEDQWTANEMRRDATQVGSNDNFGLVFDTYYDRRNGYFFYTNPLGAMIDVQVTNEGSPNFDWNPVWAVRTGRFDGGWTVEVRIPFKSIKYRPGASQVWGVQLRRAIRRKNEWSHLTFVPRAAATAGGRNGIIRMSRAATLVGLEAPPIGLSLDVKPYGIGSLTTDRTAASPKSNELDGSGGVDLKWGVTQNLTADFTYNTDFAQVEVDQQQVNLTRFSLFFPEKREFFLENAGLFNFGGAGGFGRGNATPTLFYSRRIGLEGGREVPILAGGRLTGRMGAFNVGVINIQTKANANRDLPATNFSVARVRRDILRRSSIGAILTNRSDTPGSLGSAQAYGVDASFAFYENLEFQTYIAQTKNPGRDGEDTSYRTRMEYDGDLYGVTIDHLGVGANFNPAVGFARRTDIRRTFGQLRYSPRPNSIDAIRQFTFQLQGQYIENSAGQIETRQAQAQFQVQFESSDRIQVQYTPGYELLPFDFNLSTGVRVPAGGYSTDTARASFTVGQQRFASGTWAISRSEFYGGHRWSYGYTGARVKLHPQLAVEPGISVNQVTTPFGDFTTELYSSRVTYTATPLMFVSGLVQYNSARDSVSTNVRLRWEYQPGSELFVVYNEGRDTTTSGLPDLQNRSLIVKVNRLFRF
jgi:hypothetical protein